MTYAILCLAAGGSHVSILPSENVSSNTAFGFVHEGPKYNADSDFVSVLASGAHLHGLSPGTSPEGTIYWLNNVLVVLTAQLFRPGAASKGIARIVLHCQDHCPTQAVYAVLISVEHVVLVHVAPDGNVQHTATMPLLDRYAKPYPERQRAESRKFLQKAMDKGDIGSIERQLIKDLLDHGREMNSDEKVESDEEDESALYTTRVDGNINSTFYALVHLFEAGACQHMPDTKVGKVVRVNTGIFSNEIYDQITKEITDLETRESLMKVSRAFRKTCQEDLVFAKGLIIKPSQACQSCDKPTRIPKWFEKYNTDTGTRSRAALLGLTFKRYSPIFLQTTPSFDKERRSSWLVAIGTEHKKKSLLAEVAFKFVNV